MVKNSVQETEHWLCPPKHTELPTDAKGKKKGMNVTTASKFRNGGRGVTSSKNSSVSQIHRGEGE